MTIKERVARAVQTATQLGLRRAGWILWACYGLLLLVVIYLAVSYSTTDDSVSITLTRINAEDARGVDRLVRRSCHFSIRPCCPCRCSVRSGSSTP